MGCALLRRYQNKSSIFYFCWELNHNINIDDDDTCVVNTVLLDAAVEGKDLASCCSSLPVQMAGGLCFRAWVLGCIVINTSQHPPEIPWLILVLLRTSKHLQEAVEFIGQLIMWPPQQQKSFTTTASIFVAELCCSSVQVVPLSSPHTETNSLQPCPPHPLFLCPLASGPFDPSINLLFSLPPF